LEGLRGHGGPTMATQGSPDPQESRKKEKSTVCITGVNKIAPNFLRLVAKYTYMSFGFLKTSQRNIYIYIYIYVVQQLRVKM
jgi:hypothetical protein